MRYYGLATDYDGTIAAGASVSESTVDALRRLKQSGRKLILVTGRELPDLLGVFKHTELFDSIVVENGALLYHPATKQQQLLTESPPQAFLDMLRKHGVTPLSIGRSIVATIQPHETTVLAAIRELGLELHVIFNKGAVMILPSGVNKATGLAAALKELGLSRHNMVGVGDAENDHAFLEQCECAVAVANALPALKERADLVTRRDHGDGVAEMIDQLLADDLAGVEPRLARHALVLGLDDQASEFKIRPYRNRILIAGGTAAERSTFITGFLERLFHQEYQACVVDLEGSYPALSEALLFGSSQSSPSIENALQALDRPQENIVLSVDGVSQTERMSLVEGSLSALHSLYGRTGRPHWLVLNQAQQVLAALESAPRLLADFGNVLLESTDPRSIPHSTLKALDVIVAIGENAPEVLRSFWIAHESKPAAAPKQAQPGAALAWRRGDPNVSRLRIAAIQDHQQISKGASQT